jgi:uncharacterized membrane protein
MYTKILSTIKPFLKSIVVIGLALTLIFAQADSALAARSGGRMGGGSFRMPSSSRTYSTPRTSPQRPSGNYGGGYGGYYGGGGFGFPFLLPWFGFGGFGATGGLFTILIVITIANFLLQSFRRYQEGSSEELSENPTVSVSRLQVGLLAGARELQADLDRIALKSDTSSTAGLTHVLQETTLALLRHPEYWAYAGSEVQETRLNAAEAQFNRYSLTERSKFSAETLSNYNSQLKQASAQTAVIAPQSAGELAEAKGPGEYIVVTLLVGSQGKLQLPDVRSADDLRKALSVLGGVGSDRLLAVEVLWTPEAEGDVLTSDDVLVEYPALKLV